MKVISFDNSRKGIATNAVLGFLFQFLIKFKGVLILPLIVHFLSKETLGEWRLITTTVMIILPVISLNVLDGSGMFFSADLEKRRVRIKYYSLFNLVLLITVLVSILSIIISYSLHLWEDYIWAIVLMFNSTVFKKLSIFLYETYQKSKILLKINFFAEYGAAAVSLFLIYIGMRNIYVLLFPIVGLNFVLAVIFIRKVHEEIQFDFFMNKNFIKKVLPISIPLIPVYVTEWVLSSIGIYFLQYYYTVEVVGSYSVLLSIASILLALRATLQFFWFSTCSNLLGTGKMQDFKLIMKEVVKAYLVLGVLSLVFYGFFSSDIVTILANKNYVSIIHPLYITVIGYVFLVFSTIWNGILYSMGKSKNILWSYIISAVSIILLSLILIKYYGILGASISYTLGNLILFVCMYFSVKEIGFPINRNEKAIIWLFLFVVLLVSFCSGVEMGNNIRRLVGLLSFTGVIVISYFSGFINPLNLIKIFKK